MFVKVGGDLFDVIWAEIHIWSERKILVVKYFCGSLGQKLSLDKMNVI